jgi:uncharacterized membrane protein
MPRAGALLLAGLLLGGCTGTLVDRLNERQVQSCVWWHTMWGTARGVTATGGTDINVCLRVPSQLP